jgi:dolichol-phosphate mannosyltransferase
MSIQTQAPNLSVVAPCYNEEASLPAFLDRMEQACQAHANGTYEIILVNDGSRDRTWSCIQALAATRVGVVGLNLSRNHGHQLAVTAGLAQATGARVLIIDADLQEPPELLAQMMARMDEGADVVFGRRRTREGETRLKLLTAALFYRLLGSLSEVEIPRDTGDFRLMNRRITDLLCSMPEQDRFLRGMVAWLGGRQVEVLYDRPAREAGVTGYSLWKMLRLAVGGLTSFSTAPLRLASLLAVAGAFAGVVILAFALAGFLTGHAVPGWTSLAFLITLFSTAQLATLAILGAYVGRIFTQVKGRPLFIVDKRVGSPFRVGLSPASGPGPDRDIDDAVSTPEVRVASR